jgi:hypothetical protein
VSDGSLLFLLHLISKMRDPGDGGSRIGIILNGSPLFNCATVIKTAALVFVSVSSNPTMT